ncbi:hypothetical protein [Dyella sp. M7H15-1]|uniref:hypothetical protein n=1 Tax=Dyella sp. M7H15-1 TaxID=2501295 RepID=UPI0013E8A614|nr:hypothetical protein [Dyella sp. M7H15-1]
MREVLGNVSGSTRKGAQILRRSPNSCDTVIPMKAGMTSAKQRVFAEALFNSEAGQWR